MKYLFIIALTFYTTCVFSQSIQKKTNAYIESYVNTMDFSGCVIILKGDSILFQECYGYANHNYKIENIVTTKFKIGSISKQFTAAAILRLEEMGLLSVYDKLSKYFPEHAEHANITIHHLLTHTSGVTDIFNLPGFNSLSCEKLTLRELAELILHEELLFNTGENFQYSNGGYALLGYIIELVSQKSNPEFLEEAIFLPLKMSSSGHRHNNAIIEDLALGHEPLGSNQIVETDFIDNNLLIGSGSLYSNIEDMNTWISTIANKEFSSQESRS